jgi:hypothetical protein
MLAAHGVGIARALSLFLVSMNLQVRHEMPWSGRVDRTGPNP